MSHRHRKTKQKNEGLPIHSTILNASSASGVNTGELWRKRMMLMDQVTRLREEKFYDVAIPLQQEICAIDEKIQGRDSSAAGLSWNKLGEIQFENKNFADSEVSLQRAVEIREGIREDFDTAVSRDNLARIFETDGRMDEARQMRLRGRSSQNIACGCFTCKFLQQGVGFDQLKACSRCKAVFYCSADCQKVDWKERHKLYCKAPVQSATAM